MKWFSYENDDFCIQTMIFSFRYFLFFIIFGLNHYPNAKIWKQKCSSEWENVIVFYRKIIIRNTKWPPNFCTISFSHYEVLDPAAWWLQLIVPLHRQVFEFELEVTLAMLEADLLVRLLHLDLTLRHFHRKIHKFQPEQTTFFLHKLKWSFFTKTISQFWYLIWFLFTF